MTTITTLNDIKRHLAKSFALLETVIASLPKQNAGKPPMPRYGSTAWRLFQIWDDLKKLDKFTAHKAKQIVKGDGKQRFGTDSSYSSVLSKWARDSHIQLCERGTGPFPAYYKIPE
jgi:hypothetical protein